MLRQLTALLFSFGMLLAAVNPVQATILTFDVRNDNGTPPGAVAAPNGQLPTTYAGYGDFVAATTQDVGSIYYNYGTGNGFTPNIGLSYSNGTAAQLYEIHLELGFWGSQQIAYPLALSGQETTADDKYYMTFTPSDSTYGSILNSFQIFDSTGANSHTVDWKVYKDSIGLGNILNSGTVGPFGSSVGSPMVISPGTQYQGTMILELHLTAGPRGQLGIDNVNFDQFYVAPVPEPATLHLAGLALLAAAKFRRRKNQS